MLTSAAEGAATRARPARAVARLAAAAALASALVTGATSGAGAVDLPSTVAPATTLPAQRLCFTDNVRVTGFLVPRAEAYVFGGVEGYRIAAVLVEEGDTVSAHQEIIRLEPASPGASAGSGPTGLSGAGAGPPRPALPVVLLRSPADGIVSSSTARVGGLASARSEPLLRITTDPELDLVVDIPSAYASRVRPGGSARILQANGSELEATVRVGPAEIDARTQFGRARIGVPSGSGLRPGLFGRAFVETDESCGVAVPKGAILRQNNATSVVVVRSGRSEVRRVEVGLTSDSHVEIRSGLSEGENVVANPAGAL
jgi:multidrug efflux pump subunit AcrA (membrane-fusion protein)